MDGIVAKRTLKKSYYNEEKIGYTKSYENKGNDKTSFKEKLFFKLAIQVVTAIAILLFVIAVNILNIQVVKNSAIVKNLKTEWNKNYTLNNINSYAKKILKNTYVFIKPIVPNKIKVIVKDGINRIDKNDKNIDSTVDIYKEVNIYEEINNSESENKEIENVLENIGTSVEQENQVITAVSSLSYQDEIVTNIKKTGITFIKPVSGSITSNFGAREEIFKGVDSYHTGTDIGAKSGTKVVSSISGTVTIATYNQYNGNYVEITNGNVVTKYLHLSKITVKKGVSIKAGEKIGEVGSTGLSTGPHLHFEVVYKGTKIDPRLVVDL